MGKGEAAYNLTEARENLQEIWAAFSRSKFGRDHPAGRPMPVDFAPLNKQMDGKREAGPPVAEDIIQWADFLVPLARMAHILSETLGLALSFAPPPFPSTPQPPSGASSSARFMSPQSFSL